MKALTNKISVIGLSILTFVSFTQPLDADDALIQSTFPTIFFDDTSVLPGSDEWQVNGTSIGFGIFNSGTLIHPLYLHPETTLQWSLGSDAIALVDKRDDSGILLIHEDAPGSFGIDNIGDMALAGGSLFIDRSLGTIGIGTAFPTQDLHIADIQPGIIYEDISIDSADWYVGNLVNDFSFGVFDNGTGGPTGEFLTLDAQTGFIGMNNVNPATALHIGSPNNSSAHVFVENTTTAVAPRTLLTLANPGNTKFVITNADDMKSWAFANSALGNEFRISLQGSGVVEFTVDNFGDAYLAGTLYTNSDRNAKTNITPVDPDLILQKVSELPINQWAYKETPGSHHIGPMAQDFRAAFGTGEKDTSLATMDVGGVAIASIQALNKKLEDRNLELERRIDQLEALVTQLLPRVSQN